jgi:hypothetical protein
VTKKRAKIQKRAKNENMQIPIVEVTWNDAGSSHGWTSDHGYEAFCEDEITVKTLGFLMQMDKNKVVVSQNISEDSSNGGLGNIMRIPTKMVVNIRNLGFYKTKFFELKRSK